MPEMDHPELGRLSFTDDPQFGRSFSGAFATDAGEVALTIDADGGPEESALALAQMLVMHWDAVVARSRAATVESMMGIYNADWRAEDAPVLTEAEFAGRLTVGSLQVLGGSDCSVWFTDKDLFWGHSIHVDFFELGSTPVSVQSAKVHAGMFG